KRIRGAPLHRLRGDGAPPRRGRKLAGGHAARVRRRAAGPRPRGPAQGLRRARALLRDRIRGGPPRPRAAPPAGSRPLIGSRAPVRFSLGGGGTDLIPYSRAFGGYLVSAAIDKYIYVTANKRFHRDIRLAYSKTEIVSSVDRIEHPLFREALRMTRI